MLKKITTKTAIVELLLEDFALSEKNEFLSYVGILKENEAETMRRHIRRSRRNKMKNVKL